jgi:hypothetical protein
MLHSVAIFASMMILIRRTLNEKLGFENTKINHHEKKCSLKMSFDSKGTFFTKHGVLGKSHGLPTHFYLSPSKRSSNSIGS